MPPTPQTHQRSSQVKKTLVIWAVMIAVGVAIVRGVSVPRPVTLALGAIGLALAGTALWGVLVACAVRLHARVLGLVGLVAATVGTVAALELVGRRLLGPVVGALPALAPPVVAAWFGWRQLRIRRVYRTVNSGAPLPGPELAMARTLSERVSIAVALLSRRHARCAVEVLTEGPPLDGIGRYWRIEAHLACGARDTAAAEVPALDQASPGIAAVARARLATLDARPAEALTYLERIAPGHGWPFVELARADALAALGRFDAATAAMNAAAACARFDVWRYVVAADRPAATLAGASAYR